VDKAKPFCISKWEVWEAYKRVKANQGAAGVDGQSIAEIEVGLKDNLFKVWNRISSGSYFPPPVRRVDIPKDNGGTRPLGIPTVADRIAQTVVKRHLEPILEEKFHPDSYGYRPKKSAIEAIGVARQRCWRYDWVLDLDIKGFFDNIDHGLLMRVVRKHTDWMKRQNPRIPFERYADDVICHCRSKDKAEGLRKSIEGRLAECRLELNSQKTKIVYCKDDDRRGNYPEQKFDFLGYTFRPREAKNPQGVFFVGFNPAISNKAKKSICDAMRQWRLHRRTDKSLDELAHRINPVLRGWINYYGRYRRSALYRVFQHLNNIFVRWASRKYKRLRGYNHRARQWLQDVMNRQPGLFVHWQLSQVKAGQ
jgi:RNA-directed DNA polymerase